MSFEDVLEQVLGDEDDRSQYDAQIGRIKSDGLQTDCISQAVSGVLQKLPGSPTNSLVVYGDPQSGKTEMMICLTAALLDQDYRTVVHLMNDSVDLLKQNMDRFRISKLSPSPRLATDLVNSPLAGASRAIIFCKKNARDLDKLLNALGSRPSPVVIDDEADYATPNSKVNQDTRTSINRKIYQLLGDDGVYIGVTATPARLNLNNTFDNMTEEWVKFPPHNNYTGQETFFPIDKDVDYRLVMLGGEATPDDAKGAFVRFLVTVAYLNVFKNEEEKNYSFLMHTSGRRDDHGVDRGQIEEVIESLMDVDGDGFQNAMQMVYDSACHLYPAANSVALLKYVKTNIARNAFVVLNSDRDRIALGDEPTVPKCPFTVIIGGNIVSRGVTFPNLLSMFFTRNTKTKIQQDTYIQRARMFGARGDYLSHFELTIPEQLYHDWHRAFFFHKLALESITEKSTSPVWVGDKRISVVAGASVDRATVNFNKGEMSFEMFDLPDPVVLDEIIKSGEPAVEIINKLREKIGEALPLHLVDHLDYAASRQPGSVVVHPCYRVARYQDKKIVETLTREKGFIGRSQLRASQYPGARHHVFVLHNDNGKARVVYKNTSSVQFIQNAK